MKSSPMSILGLAFVLCAGHAVAVSLRASNTTSRNVKDSKGSVIGREVAGMQSTVHCAKEVAHPDDTQCVPADLSKPVPTCTEVGQSGRCPCAAIVNEPLKLPYQQQMVSEAIKLCE